jgi:hypothetical protein
MILKVLLVGDPCGVHSSLHYGLMKIGVDSHLLLLEKSTTNPKSVGDNVEVYFPSRWIRPFGNFLKALFLPKYDVITFAHRISFLPRSVPYRYSDLPILKRKTKVLGYTALGCDEIALLKYNTNFTYISCNGCEKGDSAFRGCVKNIRPLHTLASRKLRKYFDSVVVSAPEYAHVAELYDPISIIPFPVRYDLLEWSPAKFSKEAVNIIHSPTRRFFKGTDVVEEAISILKSRGIRFNYKLVSGLPWEEYMQVMQEADIVIDQVWCHSLGMNALWMLAMGKVVFSGASTEAYALAPWQAESPAFNAEPDPQALAASLEKVITNWNSYSDLPARGLAYVKKVHDPEKVARQYVEAWTNSMGRK